MSAAALLERLEGVKPSPGKPGHAGHWRARCPSHKSKSATLAISETVDGRVLVHCFAGCTAADVVAAVGLDIADLMPPAVHRYAPVRPVGGLWNIARDELDVVWVSASNLAKGIPLTTADRERLLLAADRIEQIQRQLAPK